jgi:hypothetical protein
VAADRKTIQRINQRNAAQRAGNTLAATQQKVAAARANNLWTPPFAGKAN